VSQRTVGVRRPGSADDHQRVLFGAQPRRSGVGEPLGLTLGEPRPEDRPLRAQAPLADRGPETPAPTPIGNVVGDEVEAAPPETLTRAQAVSAASGAGPPDGGVPL